MATENVPQQGVSRKLSSSNNGVLTLHGFGIRVRMQRGHLDVEDGIGTERRHFRLPRVGHGLERLVIIGSDGFVSLAALRWLADQDAAFVMLERNGKVLTVCGPVSHSDARLRRAQALAPQSGAALQITRELIAQKLAGQEQVARKKLLDEKTADIIREFRDAVPSAQTIHAVLHLESQGASAYWSAWRDLPIMFPKVDLPKIPEHWRTFGSRKSPLSRSPRLAASPGNAILNYLYAVLESETRLAVAALGLDPGLGFFHKDTLARDSLACDVMEAVRPQVDAYLLDWITREPLKRAWLFEQRNGNCRLMSTLAIQLSQTAMTWARAVAPIAEWVARTLWVGRSNSTQFIGPATRLTNRRKREAKGRPSSLPPLPTPAPETICRNCGKNTRRGGLHCANCATASASERLVEVSRLGRMVAHTPEARAKEGSTQRQHARARSSWTQTSQPDLPSFEVYTRHIQPKLASVSNSCIASAIGVSRWYAGRIRRGYRPHPRHWQKLGGLVGVKARPD